ncbi:hypothetical protein HAX54_033337 [Datura stramonium]|uniref:Uncharacterized protein n=1 Tax=Datura stramonium TaxID=4076 RepID=A0ABS8SDC2_DATST|nr:hypothetical protein [Datura stramonium]
MKNSTLNGTSNRRWTDVLEFPIDLSRPIAISWICSGEKVLAVPNETNMTELSGCLSSHSIHLCLLQPSLPPPPPSMWTGLNGPRPQNGLSLCLESASRYGPSISLQEGP